VNIQELLIKEHSKTQCLAIKSAVLGNHALMPDLMECFFSDYNRLGQRAAWPVSYIAIENPTLIMPYLPEMVKMLDEPHHDAILRNTIRILQDIDIPEEIEGEVYEKCFNLFNDPKRAIAIRVFAMSVCTNVAIKYPELKEELVSLIQIYNTSDAKPAYKSRAKMCLNRLK
jgi:hypothetical protein